MWIPFLPWLGLITWLVVASGLAAIPLLFQSNAAKFILACWLGYALLSLVYYASDRFLVTILPLCCISVSIIIKELLETNISKNKITLTLLILAALLSINPLLSYNRFREIGFGYYNLGVYYGTAESTGIDGIENQQSFSNNSHAQACYEKALLYLPNHPSSLLNLGVIYSLGGNYEKADICFKKVLEIDANNQTAKRNLEINQNHSKN